MKNPFSLIFSSIHTSSDSSQFIQVLLLLLIHFFLFRKWNVRSLRFISSFKLFIFMKSICSAAKFMPYNFNYPSIPFVFPFKFPLTFFRLVDSVGIIIFFMSYYYICICKCMHIPNAARFSCIFCSYNAIGWLLTLELLFFCIYLRPQYCEKGIFVCCINLVCTNCRFFQAISQIRKT